MKRRGIGELVSTLIVVSIVILASIVVAGYISYAGKVSEAKPSTSTITFCSILLSGNKLFVSASLTSIGKVKPTSVYIYDSNLTEVGSFTPTGNSTSISGVLTLTPSDSGRLANTIVVVIVEYKSLYTGSISGAMCTGKVEVVS